MGTGSFRGKIRKVGETRSVLVVVGLWRRKAEDWGISSTEDCNDGQP
jgi:hypothetical protein